LHSKKTAGSNWEKSVLIAPNKSAFMLSLFRNNQLQTALLYFIIAGTLLFLKFYYLGIDVPEGDNALNFIGFKGLANNYLSTAYVFFGLLHIIQAFWINSTVNYFRIGKKTSFYTALFYTAFVFSFENLEIISSALISGFFVVASISEYYKSYDRKNSVKELFNAAMFIGIAALVFPSNLFYIPFAFAAWLKVRTFNIKEFGVLLSGLFVPFYLAGTYMYLNGELLSWLAGIVRNFGPIVFNFEYNLFFIIGLSIWVLLLVIAIINYSGIKSKTNIREQKFIDLLFFLLIFSNLFWIFNKNCGIQDFLLAAIPISIFISLNLQTIKNNRLSELFFLLIILALLIGGFGQNILATIQ
jgi:hypothetical protein